MKPTQVYAALPLVLLCGLAAGGGCSAATRSYQPRADLVAQMGAFEAAQALEQALQQVAAPVISAVRFGADHIAFACQSANLRDSRFSSDHVVVRTLRCRSHDMRLSFRELARIDIIRPSHRLVLRTASGARLATLAPSNEEHALRIVDLLASLRAAVEREAPVSFAPLEVIYDREIRQIASGGQ